MTSNLGTRLPNQREGRVWVQCNCTQKAIMGYISVHEDSQSTDWRWYGGSQGGVRGI